MKVAWVSPGGGCTEDGHDDHDGKRPAVGTLAPKLVTQHTKQHLATAGQEAQEGRRLSDMNKRDEETRRHPLRRVQHSCMQQACSQGNIHPRWHFQRSSTTNTTIVTTALRAWTAAGQFVIKGAAVIVMTMTAAPLHHSNLTTAQSSVLHHARRPAQVIHASTNTRVPA
jgi:hypothetical protein